MSEPAAVLDEVLLRELMMEALVRRSKLVLDVLVCRVVVDEVEGRAAVLSRGPSWVVLGATGALNSNSALGGLADDRVRPSPMVDDVVLKLELLLTPTSKPSTDGAPGLREAGAAAEVRGRGALNVTSATVDWLDIPSRGGRVERERGAAGGLEGATDTTSGFHEAPRDGASQDVTMLRMELRFEAVGAVELVQRGPMLAAYGDLKRTVFKGVKYALSRAPREWLFRCTFRGSLVSFEIELGKGECRWVFMNF